MPRIDESRILILATDGFEQSEFEVPHAKLKERGAEVLVATPDGKGDSRGWEDGDWGREVDADLALADVEASEYDAIVLPGGQINPDKLRTSMPPCASCATSSTAARSWPPSATGPGCWSRRMLCAAVR